jgi:hypothetical protein
MNDGVKLLLDRMETNPEEFTTKDFSGNSRWSHLINYYDGILTDEERNALKAKQTELLRKELTQAVMQELMHENRAGSWSDNFKRQAKELRSKNLIPPFCGEVE